MENLWWLIILAAMAIYACYTDCRYREISNRLALCMALWTLSRLEFHSEAQHLIHPIAVLLAGGVLFQMNILAAGDSKLFAVLSLAIDSKFIAVTLLLIGFLGGVLAISQWWLGRMTADIRWTQRGVPYAVPICLASLLAIAASL